MTALPDGNMPIKISRVSDTAPSLVRRKPSPNPAPAAPAAPVAVVAVSEEAAAGVEEDEVAHAPEDAAAAEDAAAGAGATPVVDADAKVSLLLLPSSLSAIELNNEAPLLADGLNFTFTPVYLCSTPFQISILGLARRSLRTAHACASSGAL
jgi:hypothetical protein